MGALAASLEGDRLEVAWADSTQSSFSLAWLEQHYRRAQPQAGSWPAGQALTAPAGGCPAVGEGKAGGAAGHHQGGLAALHGGGGGGHTAAH